MYGGHWRSVPPYKKPSSRKCEHPSTSSRVVTADSSSSSVTTVVFAIPTGQHQFMANIWRRLPMSGSLADAEIRRPQELSKIDIGEELRAKRYHIC